ncbi:MAG TPA: DNA recombination protein RmuC [Candidatus Acidoferrales bacterium]|nr:DNA recombination protein RmuC [Candidatus Acidoferrales bacterium]
MQIVTLVAIGTLAISLGIALGRYVWPALPEVDPNLLTKAQTDVARLEQECSTLRTRVTELDTEHKSAGAEAKSAREEATRLNERVIGLTRQLEDQAKQTAVLETQREMAANEANASAAEVATLKERENSLRQKIEEQTAQVAEQQHRLTAEFENIANRILAANAAELSEKSHTALSTILDPLRERIQTFQTKVETTYDAESRDVLSLKEQIKFILETSTAIGNQADGLAKALRGEKQLLGRWGELALERILEAAGLREGSEYIVQGKGLGLKSEDGGHQRPDIVVCLPDQRTMVVDSKAPLASYERLIEAKDDITREVHASQFVRDFKAHIDELADRCYQESDKLHAHDYLLMFVPIEGALAAAVTREPELFVYGWERHVVLVGPPTLLMTMRTVASIWRYQDQEEHAQDIARLAGELCDKVSMSLIDLNGVAEKITGALTAHYDAIKRFSSGKGNALSIGERIRSLGVKTKRPMPSMLVDGVSITAKMEDAEPDPVVAKDAKAQPE